ncbi:unnamed protein product [Camellia sinensis]
MRKGGREESKGGKQLVLRELIDLSPDPLQLASPAFPPGDGPYWATSPLKEICGSD